LLHIRDDLPTFDKFIIPIILDGENAWESYENDGTEFLEALYAGFKKEGITTTTISKFLEETEIKNELHSLFPGSWIGANFNIWIAHPEDQKAWQVVENLRAKLIEKKVTDKEVWNRFYILEGSDWYWWFGEEHFSLIDEIFDALFRCNAQWIYKKIDEEPPPELFSPIKKSAKVLIYQANDKMTPTIDGKITHFYEWHHAGHADVMRMGGTMHRFAGLFSTIYCGFDDTNLYLRFDIAEKDITAYEYKIKFYKPKEHDIILGKTKNVVFKFNRIAELAIPNTLLGLDGDEGVVEFIVNAQQKGVEVDRTPLLRFSVSLRKVRLFNWTV
jgi:hypothetical protein